MFDIPAEFDPTLFVGQTLATVTLGPYLVSVTFEPEPNLSITLEGAYEQTSRPSDGWVERRERLREESGPRRSALDHLKTCQKQRLVVPEGYYTVRVEGTHAECTTEPAPGCARCRPPDRRAGAGAAAGNHPAMPSTPRALLPTGRALLLLDLVVVAWVVLGIAISGQMRGLRQLSGTATKVGVAVQQTGQTLETLGSIPLVGHQVQEAGHSIDEAGASTIQSGRRSRDSIHTLSWMLGVFVAAIPAIAVLGLYLPLRVLAARERRALRELVGRYGEDPMLRHLLAQRALLTIPYHRLLDGPSGDVISFAAGEHLDALAAAEVARFGAARDARR